MDNRKVDLSIADGIGNITLTDPEHHNTVDLRFTREFADAAVRCETDPTVKVVVIRARGTVFSFGGDIKEFIAKRDVIQAHVRQMAAYFHNAILTLNRMRAPVIAAVNGMAAGGGFSLVCMSDMAVAARSAKFNFAYTRSGLTPDGGSTYFLTRLVGPQKAFDIMATNPTLNAEQAQALGIIARVVDDDKLESAVVTLVDGLLALPSQALPRLKGLLRTALNASLEQQLEHEAKSVSEIAATAETMDTLKAFLDK